jgi:hypothetical protein
MATDGLKMKSGNKGLTVKINLWALEKYAETFNSQMARLWMKGQVTHADTGEVLKFNDAGELVSILGKWNSAKFQKFKKTAKAPSKASLKKRVPSS